MECEFSLPTRVGNEVTKLQELYSIVHKRTHFANPQSYLDLREAHTIEIDSCSYITHVDYWTYVFQMSCLKISIYLVCLSSGLIPGTPNISTSSLYI